MAKVSKADKKTKPVKKQESSSSLSDSLSDSLSSSSSSDLSSSESEAEEKKEKKDSSDSESSLSSSSSDSDSSDSDSDSDDEEEKKEVKKDAKKEEKKEESSSTSSSSESSDSEADDESSDSEEEKKDGSSSDSDSDSDSEDKEEEKSKKRKAEESEEAPAKKAKTEADEPATLFVGRLSWNIDDDWLKSEFEPLGGVTGARVMMERSTGKSRGYGYVDFETKEAAQNALDQFQGREIDGRPINLDMSSSKPRELTPQSRAKQFGDSQSPPSDTLFIGNLAFDSDRDELFNIFGNYGSVISCRLPTHPDTQQLKGFGYIQMGSVDEAKAALEAMNGEFVFNRKIRLDYSTPRDPSSRPQGGFNSRPQGGFNSRPQGGNFRGGRDRSSGPPSRGPKSGNFQGTKKTFD